MPRSHWSPGRRPGELQPRHQVVEVPGVEAEHQRHEGAEEHGEQPAPPVPPRPEHRAEAVPHRAAAARTRGRLAGVRGGARRVPNGAVKKSYRGILKLVKSRTITCRPKS